MNTGKDPTVLKKRSYEILQDPRECYKIGRDHKQISMESSTILDKIL